MWTWPWRRDRHHPPDLPPAVERRLQDWQEWRPTSRRTQIVIVVLAVATAAGVLLAMLQPQLKLMRAKSTAGPDAADAGGAAGPAAAAASGADCTARPGEGCAGGKLDVLLLPAPSR